MNACNRLVLCVLVFGALVVSPPLVGGSPEAGPSKGICAQPDIDPAQARRIAEASRTILSQPLQEGSIQIPIAFHVVSSGKKGRVTDSQIAALINNLNLGFAGTPFSFYLYRVDRTNNKSWYSNCGIDTKNEKKMKQRLAYDTRYVLNIYSCVPTFSNLPPGQILVGYAYQPYWFPENSSRHGVVLHPTVLPGGGNADYGQYGLVGIHEVGHYLGLFHTFQGGCADGDLVSDTPAQAAAHFACLIGIDTCSDSAGPDDTRNFMNYSNDACMNHFTQGQVELMVMETQARRPSLWQ
jgi:hypothetical protein